MGLESNIFKFTMNRRCTTINILSFTTNISYNYLTVWATFATGPTADLQTEVGSTEWLRIDFQTDKVKGGVVPVGKSLKTTPLYPK